MQEKVLVPPGQVIPQVENADLKSMSAIDSHSVFSFSCISYSGYFIHIVCPSTALILNDITITINIH